MACVLTAAAAGLAFVLSLASPEPCGPDNADLIAGCAAASADAPALRGSIATVDPNGNPWGAR